MNTMLVEYPESLPDVFRQERGEFESEMRLALAAKLFEMGKLSSGQAAQLAGLDRCGFLRTLHRFKVNAVAWDVSEVADELTHA